MGAPRSLARVDIISATGLTKTYRGRTGTVRALDGLDLTVAEGTVLGLLGPNGAGKTTTVRILATLLRPDGGRATVANFDVVREAQALRRVIGLSGQYAAVDENLMDDRARVRVRAARRAPVRFAQSLTGQRDKSVALGAR